MWMIDPIMLCNKHLLGEHVELHMFVGTINKNKKLDGYKKNGLVEVHNIKSRHQELAAEMSSRGMNHNSPLPDFKEFIFGRVDVNNSYNELIKRCSSCRSRIIEGFNN
tara:strand:- start:85 stop:408 length:324 start_codon:yes stop_codon:yes gene_type:complete